LIGCWQLLDWEVSSGSGEARSSAARWQRVGGCEPHRDQGHISGGIFFVVFLNSPRRETPKNVIKQNRENIGSDFCRFFCKDLSTRFFVERFL
jgi:hypothetical protein